MSKLRLVPRDRQVGETDWGTQTPRRFLDLEVDGISLYDRLVGLGADYITPLWIGSSEEQQTAAAIERLLGDAVPDLPGQRVAVYGCPECFDLGCGAVTVELVVTASSVRWTRWAYQTDDDQTLDTTEVGVLGDLEFDRAEYEQTLRGWRSAVDARQS